MPIFTVSIDLDADQAMLVERTAALFDMALPAFLAAALTSGIVHAHHQAERRIEDDKPKHGWSGDMDDGIPF